ncbi:2-dehydro-3-deoxygalactonokinase [Rhizobium paknamense]|uniref:2-dehydro-3-deoxygalactonokinase n=1 Tax=Rhizobium paknamense TaxID=1206817 RepID=A0ABU0ID13_9HYPH|nr:2-dehydro-3-deoxygalactonokinase [Rhizobium paknamense]MDQ0456134.1 2-dehydro-3-deoxygalactonokinase [Rhizobium paknamense]
MTAAASPDASPFVALVDWGTSNFRLWLVDGEGNILGERQSADGMSACAAENRFAAVLEEHLEALNAPLSLPVIIAGMAGARAGWLEAPYVETPTALSDLYRYTVSPEARRPVHILPGLCQKQTGPFDVMRGEETQLAGVIAGGIETGVICMPGTHCKWVDLEEGVVRRFRTAMTGEVFDLISKQSILRLSMPGGASDLNEAAFDHAVLDAFAPTFSLTTSLFSIRAAGLLSTPAENEAASRLSGLLIGAEIAGMREFFAGGKTVHIVASPKLSALYARALHLAGADASPLDGSALVRHGLFAAARKLFIEV